MNIDKPNNLGKYDIIAILGMGEPPAKSQNAMNMTYTKSTLAVNRFDNTIQVYVSADTKKGIADFKKDYPNAVIMDDSILEDDDKWRLSAFPAESEGEAPTLDVYFKGRHKEHSEEIEKTEFKKEGRRKK